MCADWGLLHRLWFCTKLVMVLSCLFRSAADLLHEMTRDFTAPAKSAWCNHSAGWVTPGLVVLPQPGPAPVMRIKTRI